MMFDDDDGVEPQVKVVDEYYFEDEDEPVCFSILPFYFHDNDKVADCASEKKVYLRGVLDKSLYPVHRNVIAWSVELDFEQPNISVLSSEGNWITLSKPRKCYQKEFARSILITVQMLHFVRKQPTNKRGLLDHLWDHLYEVFDKLETKPAVDDLRKHRSLIRLIVEKDPVLIKSKILQRFVADTAMKNTEPKTTSTEVQFIVSGESHARKNNNDGDYGDKDDKNNGEYSYSDHASDDDFIYRDDKTEDNYSYSEEDNDGDDSSDCTEDNCSDSEGDNNGDDSSDGYPDNDDDTDAVCAICDDGGRLLGCTGQCKRSFHPRLKDGRLSKCRTLGYTSAQLKEISAFLCKNCEYKQHQCFSCGELEPSDELNAKVFKCNNASCGHFYHPKCVAKLLEPHDGTCELARRIVAGMSFTCPVHWCFRCGKMEDRSQRALQFAVLVFHRKISFEPKGKHVKRRAWELSSIILMYCEDHKVYKATGTAGRNHIKFPRIPEVSKTRYLSEKKVKGGGKRKMSVDRFSTKSRDLLNRLRREEIEQNQKLAVDSSLGHVALNPERATEHLKEDLQFEPSVVGADASLSDLEAVERLETIIRSSSHVVSTRMGNSVTIKEDKETSLATSHDIVRKRVVPSSKGMDSRSVQDILSENPLVDKDAGCDRNTGDKDHSERDKTSVRCSVDEGGDPNIISHETHEQNGVLDNISVEKHAEAEGSKLNSGKEMGMECGKNAYGHDSISGQEKELSRRENLMLECTYEQDSRSEKGEIGGNDSNRSGSGNGEVTPDHINDHPPEKCPDVAHVDKATIANRTDAQPEYRCGKGREAYGSYGCQEEQNSSQHNDNPQAIDTDNAGIKLRKGREPGEKATGDLDDNRKYNHIKDARGSRSEKGEISGNDSNRSGSGNGEVTPDHINDHPPEKCLDVAHVDKATIANRTDAQPEYGCGKQREAYGSYGCQEQNSSQHTDNPQAIDTDNAGRKLRKGREPGEKATGDLDDNRKYNYRKDAREARYEDGRTVNPQARRSNHCHANHYKFKSSGLHGPQRNVDNAAAKTSEYRSRERAGPNIREETMHNIRENSSNSPIGRNARKRSRTYSPEGQRMDNHGSYPGTRNRHRYERRHHINYSSNDYVNRWPWSPREFAANFGSGRRHSPPPYLSRQEHGVTRRCSPRGPEYGTSRRHSSPFRSTTPEDWNNLTYLEYYEYGTSRRRPSPPYPRRSEYGTSRRRTPPLCPRRSNDVGCTMDWNSPPDLHYDEYDDYELGAYEAMDIDPVARYYSLGKNDGTSRLHTDVNRGGEHAAVYGQSVSDYGDRSDYVRKNGPKWGSWTLASGSVTDKYAPRLDCTNHHPKV
ncbi:hypothetical protein ACP70R_015843 [Stipagrostis hirtigluma subsp. patula]